MPGLNEPIHISPFESTAAIREGRTDRPCLCVSNENLVKFCLSGFHIFKQLPSVTTQRFPSLSSTIPVIQLLFKLLLSELVFLNTLKLSREGLYRFRPSYVPIQRFFSLSSYMQVRISLLIDPGILSICLYFFTW